MGNPLGARQDAQFKAVCTAPSFNKTPVGTGTPPLPYPVSQDLGTSTGLVGSVRFNGDPAYVLDQSSQPQCIGDDPGTAGGIRSATVNGQVKPTGASSTVRAGGQPIVRDGDPCTLNSGNCPGIYLAPGSPAPSLAADPNPPVAPETPEEQGFWASASPWVHGVLGVASFVPGLSVVTGAADAAIYAAEGNFVDAGLAAASMIPGGKVVTTAGKVVKGAAELVMAEKAANAAVEVERAAQAAKLAREAEEAAKLKKLEEESAALRKAQNGAGGPKTARDGVKVKGDERKLKPGSPEHKADRWKRYQDRQGRKSYEQWSKQYDINMRNAERGLQREAQYRQALGGDSGMLKTPQTNRQVDILDSANNYAGQLKTGPVSLTKENLLAIEKDGWLVKQGWTVEHILEQGASKPYIGALEKAGIDYRIGPQIP